MPKPGVFPVKADSELCEWGQLELGLNGVILESKNFPSDKTPNLVCQADRN